VVVRQPGHDLTVDIEGVHRVDLSAGPCVVAARRAVVLAGPARAGSGSHSA
jgi:hypothetical protein